MNRQVQRLWQRALRRVGAPGLLALALLLPTLIIGLSMHVSQQRADELRATLAARADAIARQGQPVRRTLSQGEQVGEFAATFPPLAQSASDLERVFDAAQRQNVSLLKGEYQLKAEPKAALVSYTATFPVRNRYGALKAFAADVLTALPHVSMDELRMTRADAGTGALDSMIRFTFIYRSP